MYSFSPGSFIVGNNLIEAHSVIFNQIKFGNGAFVVNESNIIANEDFYIKKNLYINGDNFDSYVNDINNAYNKAIDAYAIAVKAATKDWVNTRIEKVKQWVRDNFERKK